MGFLVFVLSLLTAAPAVSAPHDCGPEAIARLEAAVRDANTRIVLLESQLDSLQTVMSARSEEIQDAQGRAENIRARRTLARLLRESRNLAEQMNRENARLREVRSERADAVDRLSHCYSVRLNESLAALAGAVRGHEVERAETLMGTVQLLENKARSIAPMRTSAQRTGLPEEFITSGPQTALDRDFLLDTLRDLHDKAVRDSTETSSRLRSEQETLRLKQELRDLLSDAGMTGRDGHGFFENLGSGDIDAEIVTLEARIRELEETLESLRAAAVYYQETIGTLTRLEAQ